MVDFDFNIIAYFDIFSYYSITTIIIVFKVLSMPTLPSFTSSSPCTKGWKSMGQLEFETQINFATLL
jgi:hypothetical protein